MERDFLHIEQRYVKHSRRRRVWRKLICIMAGIVVFFTTYSLILPAITMEQTSFCGVDEHSHEENCYTQLELPLQLACSLSSLDVHVHDAACLDDSGSAICGVPDYIAHAHNNDCMDENGSLICTLPEIEKHVHDDSCYVQTESSAEGHTHTGACYTKEKGELTCTEIEQEGHTHTDACQSNNTLICQLSETEGHSHDAECRASQTVLTCPKTESAGHAHVGDCYRQEKNLICGIAESSGHGHDDSCWDAEGNLVCQTTVSEGHTHSEACWTTEEVLTCTLAEQEAHAHSDECYTTQDDVLVCTEAEQEAHAHDDGCYETSTACGLEEFAGHAHTDACFAWIDTLICGLEEGPAAEPELVLACTIPEVGEHVHSELCFETAEQSLNCGMEENETHKHNFLCYGTWELICSEEEHAHVLSCFSDPEADVETEAVWTKTLPQALSGVFADDFVAVAKSQLDYQESTANYIVLEDGVTAKGYSRYGAWYGDPYGDWNTMFVSFCLHYAQIPEAIAAPSAVSSDLAEQMQALELYISADGELPYSGDIVFFDEDMNGKADHTGVVCGVSESGSIQVIMGDHDDMVQMVTYSAADKKIMGYGILPVMPAALADSGEQSGEESTQNGSETSDAQDLTGFISSVTLQRKAVDSNEWQDVAANGEVYMDDQLRFVINYTLPKGTLSADAATVSYAVSDLITAVGDASGEVHDSNDKVIGTYTITEGGQINIEYDPEYASQNAGEDGITITGHITFAAPVDAIQIDDPDQVTIPFGEHNVSFKVVDYTAVSEDDLCVEKSAKVNKDNTVDYTITITSKNGTGSTVQLADVMTDIFWKGGLTATDADGADISDQITSAIASGHNLSMTLPQMAAGEAYTITYKAELHYPLQTTAAAANEVVVSSIDNEGSSISDTDKVESEFVNDLVSKRGELVVVDETTSEINWTITVNEGKHDISGWTLQDTLNGAEYTGSVTITDTENTEPVTTTLPYIFPENSTDTYTVTYTTSADKVFDAGKTVNKADLIAPDDTGGMTSGNIEVGDGIIYAPLDKSSGRVEYQNDGSGTAVVTWNLNISAPYGDIPAGYVLLDSLWDEQWFSEAQKAEIEAMFDELQKSYPHSALVWSYDTNNRPIGFTTTFTNALEKGDAISLTYYSTVDVGDGREEVAPIRNESKITSGTMTYTDIHTTEYSPVVFKQKRDGAITDTNDDYHKLALEGTLQWLITVTVPQDHVGKEFIVKENFPKGTTLRDDSVQWDLEILADGVFGAHEMKFDENNESVLQVTGDDASGDYTITAQKNPADNTLKIYLPSNLTANLNLKEVRFVVQLHIDDDFVWDETDTAGIYRSSFTNTVDVSVLENGNEVLLGSDTHTQTITKNDNYNVVQKKHKPEIVNNRISYSITVNPDGKNLREYSDRLVVYDELRHEVVAGKAFAADLMRDTVKAYKLTANENGELTEGEELEDFSYVFETTEVVENGTTYAVYTLEFTVPDEMPLILKYDYKIRGDGGSSDLRDLSNSAAVEGITGDPELSTDIIDNYSITGDDAGSDLASIKFCAVDSADYDITLADAKFKLSVWNADTNDFVEVSSDLVTGSAGSVGLQTVETEGEISVDVNRAYKLERIDAPEGYLSDLTPYYFYIYDSGGEFDAPEIEGAYFHQILTGATSYIPYVRSTTEISVIKYWQDYDGDPKTEVGSINVRLYRMREGEAKPEGMDPQQAVETATITNAMDWQYTFTDLPRFDADGNAYVYYVVEDAVVNYETTYDNNEGIASGTIAIINRSTEVPSYVLPNTGGTGTYLYTIGGLLLTAAVILLCYTKKRGKEEQASS